MNRLQRGSIRLTERMLETASSTIILKRDEVEITTQAVIGRYKFVTFTPDGFSVHTISRDYLVSLESISSVFPPVSGDMVLEEIGEETHVYEVLAPPDEPVWKWCDDAQTMVRIHTKFIKIGTES